MSSTLREEVLGRYGNAVGCPEHWAECPKACSLEKAGSATVKGSRVRGWNCSMGLELQDGVLYRHCVTEHVTARGVVPRAALPAPCVPLELRSQDERFRSCRVYMNHERKHHSGDKQAWPWADNCPRTVSSKGDLSQRKGCFKATCERRVGVYTTVKIIPRHVKNCQSQTPKAISNWR